MNEKQKGKFGNWIRTSITARMLMVTFLMLILLIPLGFIKELIKERTERQETVIDEINNKWGNEVLLYGPILQIPYKVYIEKIITDKQTKTVQTETIEKIKYAYFFPRNLDIKGTINPEEKKRGIYKTAVYKSNLQINGSFNKPDFSDLDIDENQIIWEKTKIIINTSNLKGVNSRVQIMVNKHAYFFTSNYMGNSSINEFRNQKIIKLHSLESNHLKSVDIPIEKEINFEMKMDVNGSEQISFIPIGKETNINLSSNWKTANFIGYFLPHNSDKINNNGFDAKWKVLDINRPFSQQFFNTLPDLSNFASGVNFMIPVDEYQKSERSVKYGFLVIALTFLVFFLIQTLSKIQIHPFQYLMIGIALTMFYTLLISISEHSDFLKAYIISAISVIVLITLYSKTILNQFKFSIFIGFSLFAMYAFIFVIIQLENYALIVGSIGLFIILALVMYISRKIDWINE
ncbi:MAG: cell envelope integrity protein CreD [Bacteroidota bacterium]